MYSETKSIWRQRRLWTVGLAAVCCLATLMPCGSGIARAAQAPPASGTMVTSPTYQIQPEDVLDINVVDHPEVNKSVPVMTDGTIDYPYVGQINVAGMTVSDLKKRLTKELAKQFVRPQVIIQVAQRRPKTFVTGGVLKGVGKHVLKEGERLLEAVADAGGLPAERAEFYTMTILRGDTQMPVDLPKLFAGDPVANIPVLPDDYIYVVEKEASQTTIQVVGQVGKPGPVTWPRDGSILTVLQAVGGPTDKALLSGVLIDRKGTKLPPVDLRNYQKNGFIPPVTLEPGDLMIVPENTKVFYMAGPLPQTGAVMYPDDKQLTLYDAVFGGLKEAGKPGVTLQGAELKKAKVVRPIPGPNGTQSTITIPVDLEHMWKTGDLSKNIPIQPNDSIIVPPSGQRRGVSIGEVLGYITGITTVYFLFKR